MERIFGENQTQLMNKAIYYLEQFRYTSQSQKSYGLSLPDKSIFTVILMNNIVNTYHQIMIRNISLNTKHINIKC